MQKVEDAYISRKRVYLPQHTVLKEYSLTTKLKVVFDTSARSSTGVSLNYVLMCGPTVLHELFSILVRFRKHQYVLTADVEKMFRQINVDAEDQYFQCIIWRKNRLTIYRRTDYRDLWNHVSVSYGDAMSCSTSGKKTRISKSCFRYPSWFLHGRSHDWSRNHSRMCFTANTNRWHFKIC